ncbi:glycosyltransferase [Aquirufa ecclesiirivi]|uniref:glycosyltransferase n=1 Tax=Aquirufa ecclesiirivi TaxID=2715124 RepID=UPI003BAE64E1
MLLLPEILVLSTYPPRECGIATYTHDLIQAIQEKYSALFRIRICTLETSQHTPDYPLSPDYRLITDQLDSYDELIEDLKENEQLQLVLIEHEFGLFEPQKLAFDHLIQSITQPIIFAFHTVLPNPNPQHLKQVQLYAKKASALIVMTQSSSQILQHDYQVDASKIQVIAHGTHLLEHSNKDELKAKYQVEGRSILSTFGFIGANKSIETTLQALPAIMKRFPKVLFLIIGKTHPNVLAQDGEKYRNYLEDMVQQMGLENHVQWINYFLPTSELLDYLSLTDIYLFTSNDPNQAVSGTFSYAISSGCPVISTRIPHAVEVLKEDMGIIIDFNQAPQLAHAVTHLLNDKAKRIQMRVNSLQHMAISAWENSAIQHMNLFQRISKINIPLHFRWPEFNLKHIEKLSTNFGIIQFAHINEPDVSSGYTLDDNARALIVLCDQFIRTQRVTDLQLICVYIDFIQFCQQANGLFLNYVSYEQAFIPQNQEVNLDDSNGRTIWALGYVISRQDALPLPLVEKVESILAKALPATEQIYSTRAMAFIIKGIFYANKRENDYLMDIFSQRLADMYSHEAKENWEWFESYLTYANGLLPEAMLLAYQATGYRKFEKIALKSFEFLLKHTFDSTEIHVISNQYWSTQEHESYQFDTLETFNQGGEQAIDVSYTMLALHTFHQFYQTHFYVDKMHVAFSWFLGNNQLKQIMYNPCTGGCYDGLEKDNVNLNQGAESTISYLMARQTMEKVIQNPIPNWQEKLVVKIH